ncbi:MAG: glucosaminidase domain-containing protein, partial [Clostridiales bacterium]|nr:glucosaminidase domain-containing protein [Clostridiales bacterium]
MTKQEFITQIAGYVQKYAPQYGIRCCSAVIAQAILESDWGESRLAAQYHNYFGLKCGTKWTGASVNMATQEEYRPGSLITIKDNFRAYSNMEEGVKGYFEFIQLARYQNLRGIKDPETYLETIKADGYATSSSYVASTMAVINQYNLTQ